MVPRMIQPGGSHGYFVDNLILFELVSNQTIVFYKIHWKRLIEFEFWIIIFFINNEQGE